MFYISPQLERTGTNSLEENSKPVNHPSLSIQRLIKIQLLLDFRNLYFPAVTLNFIKLKMIGPLMHWTGDILMYNHRNF